ncbi:Ribosomal RNA small subunit methyltransferase D [Gordonia insulae]|uniref:Ribosomal RNA small subunit methyltransferase D n=2 Tax=Gordonia insulae TaxID=2420509 RepID=A0A3G8JIF3_9ACTN|nr:Ribosomal RNA small subunit methyltransferase D [Gordonia insulae]
MIEARVDLDGAHVLDLYAGSGALGLEALSRGAATAVFVDSGRRAVSVITANVRTCGVADRSSIVARPVATHLASAPGPFDLAFLDPPYDMDNSAMTADLSALGDGRLADDGLVVVERAVRAPETVWPDDMTVLVHKTYGDTRVEVAARA